MRHPYFHTTEYDTLYYRTYLEDRLPEKMLDMHSHMNLPEHVQNVPASRVAGDWALQAGYQMTVEEARFFAKTLFPTVDYAFVAFPFPIREADMEANNRYIAARVADDSLAAGLMAVTPEMTGAQVSAQLHSGGFAGIKPYPDFVGSTKGAQVNISDFLKPEHLQSAWEAGKCVLLHLPRADRMADESNVRELRAMVSDFPGLKLIVAHLGRCYNKYYWDRAMELLGRDAEKFWFDTAGVMNPRVLGDAFSRVDPQRLMFGLDLPIFLWHGTRRWTEKSYQNLCREPLPWKPDVDPPEKQARYTFFVYEQLRNLLDVMDRNGWSGSQKQGFFYGNAAEFFQSCTTGGIV